MSLFSSPAAASTSSAPSTGDFTKDVEVKDLPTDGISQIRFSPQSEHLAVSSWNGEVRIYEIDGQGNSQGRALFKHDNNKSVLSCCWSNDGTKVFGGGTDNAGRMLDLQSQQTTQVAAHDEPISCVVATEHGGTPLLVTGSWDKTVKYWDLRQQQPIGSITCQNKVYSMSTRDKLLVVGTGDRYVNVVELNNPTRFYKTVQSPLKWQTRVVSCFADATGYAVGSIEGRCAIQYVEERDASKNFSFKCHRQTPPNSRDVSNVFAVNAISFHPTFGTFSTAGSDGTFHFWDKDAKHRLKGYPETGQTIVSTDFNRTGAIFAYACSYDWSRGFAGSQQGAVQKLMLHPIQGDECKPRPEGKKR